MYSKCSVPECSENNWNANTMNKKRYDGAQSYPFCKLVCFCFFFVFFFPEQQTLKSNPLFEQWGKPSQLNPYSSDAEHSRQNHPTHETMHP